MKDTTSARPAEPAAAHRARLRPPRAGPHRVAQGAAVSRTATPADVLSGAARWCVVEGDALALLASLPDGCVDAVVTDPPYSSGGLMRSDRTKSTDKKYTQAASQGLRQDFSGDARDQRSWAYWCALWMSECFRLASSDGRLLTFVDWRQLPAMTDAVQAGGWIWRGIVPWNKGEGTRPMPGGFRHQCEYVVWCSCGALSESKPGVTILPGYFSVLVDKDDKFHQTGKPTSLMRELVRVAPQGGVLLDPFAGSGTTGVAALAEGRRVILCERVPEYAEIARRRCEAAAQGTDWRVDPRQLSLLGGAR